MSGVIATIPRVQFSNALGIPLAGGKLITYLAGTTTPEPTFQDQELTIANPTTITLDATGSCTLWLDPTKTYKFLLKNLLGVTQPGWPVDNISGAATALSLTPTLSLYAKLSALVAAAGSSLIGFIQAGAGAILRTVQDKLREQVSVKDFGAKGDGVADDTAAIQTALLSGATIIYFPKPTAFYKTTAPIKIPNGISLRGRMRTSFVGDTVQSTKPCVRKVTNTSVQIPRQEDDELVNRDCVFYVDPDFQDTFYPQNFAIDGLSISGAGTTLIDYGIFMEQGSELLVQDCDFYGTKHGFYGRKVWRCSFNRIRNRCRFTIELGGTSLVLDTVGQNGNPNGFDGIFLNGLSYCLLECVTSDNCHEPSYNFSNCSGVTMLNCAAETNYFASTKVGWCINSTGANTLKLIGFNPVPLEGSSTPIISTFSGDIMDIDGAYLTNNRAASPLMKDLLMYWDSRVTFRSSRFSAFTSYDAPQIAWDASASVSGACVAVEAGGNRKFYNPTANTSLDITTTESKMLELRSGTDVKVKVDNFGNLLVGATTHQNFSRILGKSGTGFGGASFKSDSDSAGSATWMHFYGTSSNNSFGNIAILGNGNVQNANNSYAGISDIKLKENITDATPKLAKLMQVRVVNYNLKQDPTLKQIGVIAQELEEVFPKLVDEIPDWDEEGNLTGERTKSVKYSVLVPILIKAVQELNTKFEQYRSNHL